MQPIFLLVLLLVALTIAQNVKFTTSYFNGVIQEFTFINKDVAFVRTEEYAYGTTDGGVKWDPLNHVLCESIKCVTKVVPNSNNADVLFMIGQTADSNWIVDGLNAKKPNFQKTTVADHKCKVKKIVWHPTLQNMALALVHRPNADGMDLYLSKDGGKTWGSGPIRSQILDAQFGSTEAAQYDANKLYGIRIFEGTRYFFEFDIYHLSSIDITVENAYEFFYLKNFLFVATKLPENNQAGLYVSTDNANTFHKIKFSSEVVTENQAAFTLLDGSEGSVFINVFQSNHGSEPFGDVYLSDATGSRFSVSLFGNRRRGVACDFHKLASLEGVFIANIVSITSRQDQGCQKCKTDCDEKCKYLSVITFDKGGEWRPISGPEKDVNGKPITCPHKIPATGRCPLHLHGFTARDTAKIHSHKDAVGLVLATGNIGTYLGVSEVDVNTYFSRDGGLTWSEIAKGSHTYEMTDHGGLILIAQNKEYTDSILYSWNEGASFTKVNFTDPKNMMIIQKIYHPHDPLSRSLMIQAIKDGNSAIIHADFSDMHTRECRGVENPSNPDSDYEFFKPHSYESDKCLLGRVVEYTRRKPDRPCFNPIQAQTRPLKIQNCACTFADYTCDLYFERDFSQEDGSKVVCRIVPGEEHKVNKIPDRCVNGYYNQTRGYIKVAGDSCVGGLALDPIPRKCPSSISFFGVVLLIFFLFILLSFTSIYLYKNTSFLQNIINGPSGLVAYNPVNQNEEFGLSDNEQDSEPDEIEESTFSNFKRGETEEDDGNDFKVAALDPVEPVTLQGTETGSFNPRARKQTQ